MRIGDTVICISTGSKCLTKGMAYIIIGQQTDSSGIRYFNVIDDDGDVGTYYTERFRPFKDVPLTISGAEEYEEVMAAQEAMHGNAGILLSDE